MWPRILPPHHSTTYRSVGAGGPLRVSSPLTLRNEGTPAPKAPRSWVLAIDLRRCACRSSHRRGEGPREGGGATGTLLAEVGLPAPAGHSVATVADGDERRPEPEDRAQDRETEGEGSHPEDEGRGPEHVVHVAIIVCEVRSSTDVVGMVSGWSRTRLRVRPLASGRCRLLSPLPRPRGTRRSAPSGSDVRARDRAWRANDVRGRRRSGCPRRSRSPTPRAGAPAA